jgi:thiamine pyrophosphate-dependent acetolactate synthase large subunit-like protein
MTVEAIKAAIEDLPEPERRKLADWLEERGEQAWDAEMERDFSAGGRGHHLVEKIDQQIDDHGFTLLDEGLRSRQKKR